ncbi:hypothetical protein PAXRUDRAFT_23590 [Paxillus rubicundulus Ve08.2h10]|uniref:Uncharacterized protein n=1 Tax=Paxillus rubicundulus Ve08.2h10 TaxID=930991 RepID=A0A0D0E9V0_9AGAM|nr:hypothetical protein PAXRUDRAFT_23590 [Paxillus rubicundulus Ve08.2h10]
MAVVLSSQAHTMTPSILLRPLPLDSSMMFTHPIPPSSSSSSSSSASSSGSCLDFNRSSSVPSTRRIRFAPLPDPRRDDLACDDAPPTHLPQPMPSPQPEPTSLDALQRSFVTLSPTTSPDSSLSSTQSSHTICLPEHHFSPASEISSTQKPRSTSKLLRPLSFLRSHLPSPAHSPISNSASLPASRNTSPASLARVPSSVPNSPSSQSSKLPRISAEDILGTISFFRARSGSTSSNHPRRPPSPPPKHMQGKQLHRSSSAGPGPGPGVKLGSGNTHLGNNPASQVSSGSDARLLGGSGTKKRRASSSAFFPGAGGGRHVRSTQMLLSAGDGTGAASTSPPMKTSPLAPPKPHVRMLNGRIYGAKRYAAQTLANPFANVRDEPEFVEWGYGGMGSVHASAGIASDMWRGLQRGERGGTLLAGSTFDSLSSSAPGKEVNLDARATGTGGEDNGNITVGGGRGSGAHVRSPTSRRRMLSDNVAECGMGSVGVSNGVDEEDGSGIAWLKKRRAEREAKARVERETAERAEKEGEGRKSPDSGMDASMSASTTSNSTSLTMSTSASTTTTDLATTPATSSPASRTTSLTDLSRVPSPVGCSAPSSPATATLELSHVLPVIPPSAQPAPTPKDELHVRTAVRLSPHLSGASHKHTNSHSSMRSCATSLSQSLLQVRRAADEGDTEGDAPLSPVDTVETTMSSSSSGDEDAMAKRDSDEEEQEDDEDEAGEIATKTALGAGVEKVSRHADVEVL